MGILTNTIEGGYEAWAWSRLPRSQRLVYELEMADYAVNRLIDPDYAAAQRRASDRREWARGLHNATRARDYLTSRVMRLIAPTRAVARKQRPARRPGRSARAPASSSDDDDGDGDHDPTSRFHVPAYPGSPTRAQLAPWEAILRKSGCKTETDEPRLTARPDIPVTDTLIWQDPTNPFRTRRGSVVDELIGEEDDAAITPAVQAQLDRAAKAKAKADADRKQRQRLAVLASCGNAQQRLVFELLCSGATAEEAAAAAGYRSATVVTKMVSRWTARARKGRIAAGFEQFDLFCVEGEEVRS